MPVLIIYGIPEVTKRNLGSLISDLKTQVAEEKALGLTTDQIFVFFSNDLSQDGLGEEIVVFVEGLFKKPERTPKVLKNVAERIANTLETWANIGYFPTKCRLIEVFVKQFDPEKEGFSAIKIDK